MDLLEASKLVRREHIDEAVRLVQANGQDGFEWLYERTGRREPQSRYVVFGGARYPTKAFGFLVAQIAGKTERNSNDMNVNQAAAPLLRFGGIEVRRGERAIIKEEEERSREASYHSALARPEQARFRTMLLTAYSGCAISGVSSRFALEAAHVIEFARRGRNALANGILLRCDLHSLFDAGELAINPADMTARFSPTTRKDYSGLHKAKVSIPDGGPSPATFQERWDAFQGEA